MRRLFYSDFNELLDDTNVVVDMAIEEIRIFRCSFSDTAWEDLPFLCMEPNIRTKKLRGIITSGALTADNGNLIRGVPGGMDVHTRLTNQLGSGVCSVQEVVDWYGKDPYNKQSFTAGLCYAICDGLDWFKEKKAEFHYPVLMTHGEKDGLVSVQDTYDFFKEAGSKDKQMKIYGGLFHEILNEYCKDEVIGDMIRWMEVRI